MLWPAVFHSEECGSMWTGLGPSLGDCTPFVQASLIPSFASIYLGLAIFLLEEVGNQSTFCIMYVYICIFIEAGNSTFLYHVLINVLNFIFKIFQFFVQSSLQKQKCAITTQHTLHNFVSQIRVWCRAGGCESCDVRVVR